MAAISKDQPDAKANRQILEAMLPIVKGDINYEKLGYLDPARWQRNLKTYRDFGMIERHATFDEVVNGSDVPVMVDFWAPWCGPCKMVSPIIDNVAESLKGSAKVYKINVDENPQTAEKYGITGIPAALVFKGGRIADQMTGLRPQAVYESALTRKRF